MESGHTFLRFFFEPFPYSLTEQTRKNMSAPVFKHFVVGNISKHYGLGHGSEPYWPLFLAVFLNCLFSYNSLIHMDKSLPCNFLCLLYLHLPYTALTRHHIGPLSCGRPYAASLSPSSQSFSSFSNPSLGGQSMWTRDSGASAWTPTGWKSSTSSQVRSSMHCVHYMGGSKYKNKNKNKKSNRKSSFLCVFLPITN